MVIKRNKIWYTDFRFNGCRIRRSAKTTVKKEAEKFAINLRTELYKQNTLGEKPRRTWKEAVVRYSREAKSNRSWSDTQRHLVYLDKWLSNLYLDEITNDVIEEVIDAKLAEGVTGATVNRITSTLKTVLRKACNQYEWLNRVPAIRRLPESSGRLRWLTRSEFDQLVQALPTHAVPVVRFAVHTGLRASNLFSMTWDQVDLDRETAWVYADQHKNGEARSVPLNSEAISVLREIAAEGISETHVFTYMGKPIKSIRTALNNACKTLNLVDVTFHTFRHTYASWLVQSEVPLRTIQELGGWKSASMVQRYAHLASDGLRAYQQRLVDGHKSGHIPLETARNSIH